jgi:hypothetical protein
VLAVLIEVARTLEAAGFHLELDARPHGDGPREVGGRRGRAGRKSTKTGKTAKVLTHSTIPVLVYR